MSTIFRPAFSSRRVCAEAEGGTDRGRDWAGRSVAGSTPVEKDADASERVARRTFTVLPMVLAESSKPNTTRTQSTPLQPKRHANVLACPSSETSGTLPAAISAVFRLGRSLVRGDGGHCTRPRPRRTLASARPCGAARRQCVRASPVLSDDDLSAVDCARPEDRARPPHGCANAATETANKRNVC